MTAKLKTVSPVDGSVYVERPFAGEGEIAKSLVRARRAQDVWREVPVDERAEICSRAVDAVIAARDDIGGEITWQMGRPIRDAPGEIGGFEERARHMIAIASDALEDQPAERKEGFTRIIRREP